MSLPTGHPCLKYIKTNHYFFSNERKNKIVVFQDKNIRRIWNNSEWFFSIVDIVEVLVDSNNPRNYWSMLKKRELEAGIELSTNCVQLKLESSDGKSYLTDCANTKSMFRIIQSIPSRKAEPFKQWLAKVSYERIEEIENLELAQDRAKKYYELKGHPIYFLDYSKIGMFIKPQNIAYSWT